LKFRVGDESDVPNEANRCTQGYAQQQQAPRSAQIVEELSHEKLAG
jgi:hypothetical protein